MSEIDERILDRTPPQADHRIHYGTGELQFGDLWLPKQAHATAWSSSSYMGVGGRLNMTWRMAGTFARRCAIRELAVWSIEYRRVGNGGRLADDLSRMWRRVSTGSRTLERQYPVEPDARCRWPGAFGGGTSCVSGLRDAIMCRAWQCRAAPEPQPRITMRGSW